MDEMKNKLRQDLAPVLKDFLLGVKLFMFAAAQEEGEVYAGNLVIDVIQEELEKLRFTEATACAE